MAKTKNEKLELYIRDNLIEDVELNLKIGEVAIEDAKRRYNIRFTSPELVLGFYGVVWNTFTRTLLSKREKFPEYKINIADVIEIGYTNFGDDGESEKVGSFCPYIYNLDSKKKDYTEVDDNTQSLDRCIQWNSKNIREQVELISDITTEAVKSLNDEISLPAGSREIIVPLFVLIHEAMVTTLTLDMIDSGEEEMEFNFISCYDLKIRKQEDGYDFKFKPNVTMKGDVKSDAINNGNFED